MTAEDQIEEASRAIEYRLRQQSAADNYLEIMDLAQPDGKECVQFDISHMSDRVHVDKYRWIEKAIFARYIIFPRPIAFHGRFFYKGHHYLMATFHAANSIELQVVEKLDSLARLLEADLKEHKGKLVQVHSSGDFEGGNYSHSSLLVLSANYVLLKEETHRATLDMIPEIIEITNLETLFEFYNRRQESPLPLIRSNSFFFHEQVISLLEIPTVAKRLILLAWVLVWSPAKRIYLGYTARIRKNEKVLIIDG